MTRIPTSRRLAAVAVAALALPLAVTACGSLEEDGDGAAPGAGGGTSAPPAGGGDGPTIVTVPKLTGISWFTRMGEGTDRYAQETGVDAYMQGSGQADANAQVRVIEDLLAGGVDALAVVPFQPDAVEQVLAQAMEEDVIVITHEAPGIQNADWDLEAFRNEDYGVNLMDELASRMGEEGEYAAMVGSLSSATHMAWVEAAIAHQEETYPNMTHVGDIVETSDDSQIAYERMQELLSAYPDLKGVQGSASTDVVGVGQAVDEAGLQDTIAVVGTSTANDARAGLESGAIDLIAFWDPADAAYAMNVIAKKMLDGEEITDGMDLGVAGYEKITLDGKVIYGDEAWITVTTDNADEYDF
ncbi:autoinducer 2 ABC transporter substrate-binding protein [Georgenia sp. EYE_87]|uniref:autoinducer 2 ABC transporter substrate-binding protein n=1 Tax=Georgenia sp. EYE_87 TaxID=2853448 RepID=UPI0020059503|nr:autoinducer 2 ABC transporter substrate-binding protein [Georgenia sp. EYE_87]MCK6211660.1 autoinducer 2 ABC transporter substrate-binding protein [Georgenia sp. EYE_87]